MATASSVPYSMDIKLETGVPQTFALRFTTGKSVTSKFPGGRVMFTDLASRKLFLNDEDAGEFEHQLVDLRIQPADFIRVTKVKHGGRGGGFAIRVERIEDDGSEAAQRVERSVATVPGVRQRIAPRAAERDYTPELEQSLRNVNGPEPYWADTSSPIPAQTATATATAPEGSPKGNTPPPSKTTAAAACMMASMCSAVDAIIEVQAYATRKGIGLTFSEESVRAIGLSIYIDACRHGVR